ncbi:hypothetical protein [Acetivibrio straminisolvens]|jgi:uncharacterized protein YwlG (UPF0340 family)|uniref:Uncharacterized protein n=1 Tax=Acetivibrio straminisolvens JCM 21531 TaxID=1294263 RepID=W4VBM1_9FIRM|nr:hypothetical protein [Acetivibrio straminisolvens]GAE90581.1 hypothetical protein JCM21531_4204 [Acetivibrio straminisolvens JCM 21531]
MMGEFSSENHTSYPKLVEIIIDELAQLNIYLGREYQCKKRGDSAYIFEAISHGPDRKNIVTVWPNRKGGGSIRIVGIGKYKDRRVFDKNDIGTNEFRANLRMAYSKTK